MKRLLISVLLLTGLINTCFTQEFKARVTVNTQKLTGADKTPFTTLEQELASFINERKWSNYNLKNEEKIECNVNLIIESATSEGKCFGKLMVQLSRPVFNSSYSSSLFTYQDNDISFTYTLNQPFDYDDNSFQWDLTAIIGFYMNLFLGLHFDSFSPQGGSAFYNQSQAIINYSQSRGPGWNSGEKRSRYWLIENMTNPSYNAIRSFYYSYHRQGLDLMHKDIDQALDNILKAMEELNGFNKTKYGVLMYTLIFTAKSDEFVNVFSGASDEKRNRAYELLKQMDPLNESKYAKLLK
ncbi:MAG: DUF4835 family protein [Bacteroidales bacterium]|jgi:hypothetical protein|nr:DUF4835 family protein [Bacteroidales bacterium]MDD3329722.1 DUF4835 family protein [Bacteroidales bacterium]MDD3690488.1 DUF4835 family protein [Bacteroidales bacterium]MDD4044321.1 DUF4835 family protein [Bacteroidales bacterium]MDD4581201.1 DUF4835 family protein [Bacteroidales bacterium]